MARKVFISFLGTNNYVECKYRIGDSLSSPVRFVQEALIENTCRDWSDKDQIYVFCTSKEKTGEKGAKEINWLDNGQENARTDLEKIGLKHRLDDMNLKPAIEEVDISSGFSEAEMWDIFNTVYAKLKKGDQIYLDVTHAFRSIPLFSVVLFNYSKFMIDTQLRAIMYGAFEKLGPAYKVKEIPLEERVVPVVDMTNIAKLQEYNQVASSLKDFGKVKQLKDAIANNQESESDQTIRNLADSISELDEYIATINLKEIRKGKFIRKFRCNYKNVKKKVAKPICNILDELNNETADFVEENSFRNIEAAINWTIKHDMLMQAYPLAEEYIVMRVCDIFKELKPSRLTPKGYRIFVSSILGIPEEDFKTRNWKDSLAEYPDVADDIADDFLIHELRPIYDPLRKSRNSLAHGNGAIKYEELKANLPYIIECVKHLNAGYEQYPSTKYILQELCSST